MADCITQASNLNAHPGMVDCSNPRRSKEEAAKERQAKATAKAEVKKKKADNMQKVAKLESAAKQKTRDMERQANDLVNKMTQPQAKQTRTQAEIINKGTAHDHDRLLTDNALTGTMAQKTTWKKLKRFLGR
jgi:hypothetical protein